MNKIMAQLDDKLYPLAAMIAYKNENGEFRDSYYMELRRIDRHGKMGEAVPVTYEFMNELVSSYSENFADTPSGCVPKQLLFCDTRKGIQRYVWYNPPCKRMMYFTSGLNIQNGEYHVPGLVYVVSKGVLDIYAYKGNAPKENTPLFLAPFFNVTGGSVCLGIAKIDTPETNPSFQQVIAYWEKRFWLSEFSHLGGGGNPTKHNLVIVTKAAKNKAFNVNELKDAGKTLKQILL